MSFVVEENETLDPKAVGLFGAATIMASTKRHANLLEKLRLWLVDMWWSNSLLITLHRFDLSEACHCNLPKQKHLRLKARYAIIETGLRKTEGQPMVFVVATCCRREAAIMDALRLTFANYIDLQ